jgi:hypothetical protein
VMLLLDFWPLRRFHPQVVRSPAQGPKFEVQGSKFSGLFSSLLPLLLEKLPFFALSAASCIITFRVQKISGAMVPLANTRLNRA